MLVEFAIIAPILIMLVMGIISFGRLENYSNQETQLAEEGARWAAVDNNPSGGLQSYIKSQASGGLQNASSQLSVWIYQPTGATYAVGQPIRVCISSSAPLQLPFISKTLTLSENATMRLENVAGSNPYSSGNSTGSNPCPTS